MAEMLEFGNLGHQCMQTTERARDGRANLECDRGGGILCCALHLRPAIHKHTYTYSPTHVYRVWRICANFPGDTAPVRRLKLGRNDNVNVFLTAAYSIHTPSQIRTDILEYRLHVCPLIYYSVLTLHSIPRHRRALRVFMRVFGILVTN